MQFFFYRIVYCGILRTFTLRNSWDSMFKKAPQGTKVINFTIRTTMALHYDFVILAQILVSKVLLDPLGMSEIYSVYADRVRFLGRPLISLSCHMRGDYPFTYQLTFIPEFDCVKRVQIRSFFWSVFSCIRTEFGD